MSVVSKLYIGDNNNKAVPLQLSVADPALSDLIDTSIYAPTNGQLLQYNSATQKWENADNEAVSDALTIDQAREAEVIEGKNLMTPDVYMLGTSDVTLGDSTFTTAGTGVGFIAKLSQNTDYVISRVGGNRSRIALSANVPVSGGACNIINIDNDVTEKSFNSGSYNYVYIYASNTSETYETIQPMVCTLAEWNKSHEYEPYYVPLKDAMFRREEQRVLGAKNLCYKMSVNVDSVTINGITWTRLNDGTIKANGTATAKSVFWSNGDTNNLFEFDFSVRLNGAPKGSSNSTYHLGGAYVGVLSVGDKLFAPNSPFSIACVVQSGVTVNNIIFKPMIRLASDPDDTYQPYAMTNQELTPVESKVTLIKGTEVDNKLIKQGKLAFLQLTVSGVTANAFTSIGTVPEGFRPKANSFISAIQYNNSDAPMVLVIGADGTIMTRTNLSSVNLLTVSAVWAVS